MGSAVERGRQSQAPGAPAPPRMLVEVTPIKRPRPGSAPLGSPLLRLERERGAEAGAGAAGTSRQRNQPQHRVKSSKPEVRTSGLIKQVAGV